MADLFNPYSSGAATAVAEAPPSISTDKDSGFDPFKSGLAKAPSVSAAVPSWIDPITHWKSLYNGIEGIDQRVDTAQRAAFSDMDKVVDDPKEARARAINQSFVADAYGLQGSWVSNNWDAVKVALSEKEFGEKTAKVEERWLYGKIAERLGASGKDQVGKTGAWTWRSPTTFYGTQVPTDKGPIDVIKNAWDFPPLLHLPDPPSDLPDQWHSSTTFYGTPIYTNPAVAAGIYKGAVKPLVESLTTPVGIISLGYGAELKAASANNPLAKTALAGMSGFFAALMGYSTVKATPEALKVAFDPKSTTEQKSAALSGVAATATMSLLGALGTAFELMPDKGAKIAPAMEGKTLAESADMLRVEANRVPLDQKETVLKAAEQLELLYPPGEIPVGPVKIEAAAIREPNGTISEGADHASIKENTGAAGEEGFTLSNGQFVDRAEAMKVAKASGQLLDETHPGTGDLHSEMVAMPIKAVAAKAEVKAIEAAPAEDHLSSVKKASVNAQLARMGFEPVTPSETKSWADGVKGALSRFEKDPERGANLVRRALSGDTRFSTEDVWDSQVHERRLQDEITVAEKRYDEALTSGDKIAIDIADAELYAKQATFKQASQAFNEVMGSEAGRALNARKAMLREDYSLAALERKYRKSTGSPEIPEEVQKELAEKADKIAQLEAQLRKSQEQKVRARPPEKPRTSRLSPTVLERLSSRADEARARLTAKLGRASSGIDPTDLPDYAIVVADMIAKGVVKAADVSSRLLADFGEAIKPHVDAIVAMAHDLIASEKLSVALDKRRAQLESQIKTLSEKIEKGDLSGTATQSNRPAIEEIEKLAQQRDELRETLNGMRAQQAKVAELEAAVAEKEAKISKGDLSPNGTPKNRPAVESVEKLKQERDALNRELAEARKDAAKFSDADVIQGKVDALQERIDKKREQLTSGDVKPKGQAANRPQVEEIETARQELEQLNRELAEARKGPPKTKEEKALAAWRARTAKDIARLEAREPKPERVPTELPFTAQDLETKKQLETLKREVAVEFRRNEDARKPLWIRGAEKVKWVAETSILTSLGIFLKIPVSAFWKTVTAPFKEAVGVAAGKMFPRAAEFAGMQVQPTFASMLSGEVKAAKATVTEGARAAGEAIRNRMTTEETLYVPDSLPPEAKDFVRSVHRALHVPAQINEFTRRVSTIENNLIAAGKESTLSDPAVWTTIRVRAYTEAYRAAYLEKDALLSGLVNAAVRSIEQNGKKYNAENLAALMTIAIEMDNPIKNVPVNIISQTGEAMTGSVTGTAQILNAYRKGFEKMKPGDLDAAFRRVKTGTVGAVAMLGAWYAYKNIGGSRPGGSFLSQEDKKRKPDEPKQGQVKVGDTMLPEMGFHNETWAAAQMIASWHHLMDAQYGEATVAKNADAFLRAALGPIEDMPGIKQNLLVTAAKTKQPMKTLAQWAASRAVPSGVAQIARWLDTPGPLSFDTFMAQPTTRFPSDPADEFKVRIPVLREEVPKNRDIRQRLKK